MNTYPEQPLRIGSPAAVLAVVPPLLGFRPSNSLVVLGAAPPRGRLQVAFRYDLPDPPDSRLAARIAAHAGGILSRHHMATAVVIGYGSGELVTPVADAMRAMARRHGLTLHDVLRVHDGRYWSYLCSEPSCCSAEGVPFDADAYPAAAILATNGRAAFPSRSELAATIAPLRGPSVTSMKLATKQAACRAAELARAPDGQRRLVAGGLQAVGEAIRIYRAGQELATDDQVAWLSLVLTHLPVRDDAWARMDPVHAHAHQRLWTGLIRRAQPGYIAAPASLLAFTAWQTGNGALANIALDRALEDSPGYSMALLLREALDAGVPPSAAVPMTPEEVAASYAERDAAKD